MLINDENEDPELDDLYTPYFEFTVPSIPMNIFNPSEEQFIQTAGTAFTSVDVVLVD